jgi:glutathione S-transferase
MTDRLRPEGQHDPFGVEQAKELIATAYRMIEREMEARHWVMDEFTMVDCAAAPALFYGAMAVPFGEHRHVAAYLEHLKQRPSVARVIREAEPYFKMVPK